MKDLEDFEAFLEADFNPHSFANDLLVATNGHDVTEIDIDTSIKKLTFDIDEVEKRMTNVSSQNYQSLVSNFTEIEKTNQLVKQKITPSLDRTNTSFQNVKTGIIKPYEEASKMNSALKKIHTTLDLLRGSNFFFLLISQVEVLESTEDDKSRRNLIKLSKLYKQINELYHNEKTHKNDLQVSLLSVKLIRDYQAIHTRKNQLINESCTETIIKEFNHTTTFVIDNYKLQNNLIAYYILNPAKFNDLIDKSTVSRQINTVSGQLSKSLQSPRNFIVILEEIKLKSERYLETLTKILQACDIYSEETSLYSIYLKEVGAKTLEEVYWPQLTLKFKRSIASTMARGGPIAKNLKIYYQGIQNGLSTTFKEPQASLFLDAIELIQRGKN